MKIAITTGTFHPESGGPPTYLHRMGAEMVARGHQVRLLTFGEPSQHRYVHPVTRISRRLPLPRRLLVYTAHAARLVAWADVVFASDYGLPAALVTRIIRRPLVLKVVADFAWETADRWGLIPTTLTVQDFQRVPKRGKVALLQAIQRFYVGRADRIVVPSAFVASLVKGWGFGDDRIRVLHNAVDADRFALDLSAEQARHELGLDGRIVLSVARTIPLKGLDHVIRAVAGLRATHDLRLVHCGDGPAEPDLRQLAADLGVSDRVRFEGRVDRDRVPVYLRAADVFVLYSTVEGLSHALLEAMAAGVPPIVSDRGGNVELVTDRETGRVVSRDDPAQLEQAMDEVLSDPEAAKLLGQHARAWVTRHFGWQRLVNATLAVIAEAYNGHTRRGAHGDPSGATG